MKVAPPGAVNHGMPDEASGSTVRHQSASGREDLESGDDQDERGREGNWRDGVQHRSGNLLCDGERRVRFHLDGDAARHAGMGAGGRMWRTCPHAKAVPGVRVAYTNEREIQHAMDAGALVVVVPTVRTLEEAIAARDWTMFPPLGKRSLGGGQAFDPDVWGSVPGGYRETTNDNIVLIQMIETIGGVKEAYEIAMPGVTAMFAASGDLGNFSGYKQGDPDYERLINVVHDAAISAGKRLCGPLAWRDRPDFTCFQGGSELAAIGRGVATELGTLRTRRVSPRSGRTRRRSS